MREIHAEIMLKYMIRNSCRIHAEMHEKMRLDKKCA